MTPTFVEHAGSLAETPAAQVRTFVLAARRRSLLVAAVEQLALAASILFCGVILMLLAGTDALSAGFFAIVLGAALTVWWLRLRKRIQQPYTVAQIVDHRLQLNDAVSTAYFLLTERPVNVGTAGSYQLAQASALSAIVRPEQAFPFRGQRFWVTAAALAVVACGFFILRFLVTDSLSLRPPLVSLSLQPVFERMEQALTTKEIPRQPLDSHRPDRAEPSANGQSQADQARRDEQRLPLPPEPKAEAPAKANSPGKGDPGKPEPGKPNAPGDANGESRDSSAQSPSQDLSGANQPNSPPNAPSDRGQSPKNQGLSPKNGDAPGLMSRMKDALSSMMAKMTPQASGQKAPNSGDQTAQGGQNGQQSAKSHEQIASQQGSAGQDKADSEESASGQGDGQTAEKAGGSQGRSSDSQQKGTESQSGVGRQDGDKQIRDAEQQQAMGKLAEILGKRSANLTGEMTVETPSGNQQLKTEYSQQQGHHSDSGGEINRNEVPLRYQRYVREYMEQVRKTANARP